MDTIVDVRPVTDSPPPKRNVWPIFIGICLIVLLAAIASAVSYQPEGAESEEELPVHAPAPYIAGYQVDIPAAGYPAAPASTKP